MTTFYKQIKVSFITYSKILTTLIFFILLAQTMYGQTNSRVEKWFNEARQQMALQSYDEAKSLCYKILNRAPDFNDANLLLADIYHATDSIYKEIEYLEAARQKSEMPQISFRLGEAYYSTGQYKKALQSFEYYLNLAETSTARKSEISRKKENCKFAIEAKKKPVDFQPKRLSDNVNSYNDEYWPNLSIDQKELIFTRLIKKPGTYPQEDFFISISDSTEWAVAQPISEINTPENEGAQIISADHKLLFFTACNRGGGKGSCDIYYSRWINSKWSVPRNAGSRINTSYWEAQPAFSSDNKYLYFSSNRPGGKGNKDLWRAQFFGFDKSGNIKFGEPVNLGSNINTGGNEISPFLHPNNKNFYFASDYHVGMGGSDVFMTEIKGDSAFSKPQNLGFPLNTHNNEQGFFISADGRYAFFSSARNPETGLDIYSFEMDEEIRPQPVTYLNARVIDANTQKPLMAKIELVTLSEVPEKREETTAPNGEVIMVLPTGANYAFSVSKEGYLFFSESFVLSDTRSFYDPYKLLIELQPIEIGAKMDLYNVYFETDSYQILPTSEPELQKLSAFLTNNPNLYVEIQGHTDNTGSSIFNQNLSEKRASSVVNYLAQNGINESRLNAAGYGETLPVADNSSAKGRRLNRRTTVKILSK